MTTETITSRSSVGTSSTSTSNSNSNSNSPSNSSCDGGEAVAARDAFGQLLSAASRALGSASANAGHSVMSEARRLEDGYRARFAENDAVMKALFTVLESGNPEIENAQVLTKDTLLDALACAAAVAKSVACEDARFIRLFVASATYLLNNWNSMALGPYKNVEGSISPASARAGREQMVIEQEAIVRQILAIEINAQTLAKGQIAAAAEVEVVEEIVLEIVVKEAIVRQGQARPAEGPYQVAARLLGSDGKCIDESQVKALSLAFMQDYEQQRRTNVQLQEHLGVEAGHCFFTSDNINNLLANLADAALKERLIRIAGQDTAYRPPVILSIPARAMQANAAAPAGSFYNHVFFTR